MDPKTHRWTAIAEGVTLTLIFAAWALGYFR